MAWKGVKHASVGVGLNQEEWENEEGHDLASGATLPEAGTEKDLFFLTTDKHLYIWRD